MSRRTNRVHPAAQRAACEANEARADERAAKLAPIIKALQAEGITSLNGIAEALNERRVRTPRGDAAGMRRRSAGFWRGLRCEARSRICRMTAPSTH
jgi:hypothetical protein